MLRVNTKTSTMFLHQCNIFDPHFPKTYTSPTSTPFWIGLGGVYELIPNTSTTMTATTTGNFATGGDVDPLSIHLERERDIDRECGVSAGLKKRTTKHQGNATGSLPRGFLTLDRRRLDCLVFPFRTFSSYFQLIFVVGSSLCSSIPFAESPHPFAVSSFFCCILFLKFVGVMLYILKCFVHCPTRLSSATYLIVIFIYCFIFALSKPAQCE